MAPKRVYYRCKDDGLKEAPDLVKVDVDVNNLCWSFLTGSAVYSVYLITSTFFITSPNDVGPLFIFVFLRPYVFCGWQSRQDNNNEGKEGMKREKKREKYGKCHHSCMPVRSHTTVGDWVRRKLVSVTNVSNRFVCVCATARSSLSLFSRSQGPSPTAGTMVLPSPPPPSPPLLPWSYHGLIENIL